MALGTVLLDTDIGCDCDDAGALALLHILANNKEVEIIAVTHTTSTEYGPACIDIINRFYGRDNIPIGALNEGGFLSGPQYDTYAEKITYLFPTSFKDRNQVPDSIEVMRCSLSQQPDESVIVCLIGQMKNVAKLLQSLPDSHSPLTGIQLVQKKVKSFVVMGGDFSSYNKKSKQVLQHHAEYNIECDIPSAQFFCEQCPVEIIFTGFEIGSRIKCGSKLVAISGDENPIKKIYEIHSGGAREAWDLTAVLYAVRGLRKYWKLSRSGKVTVLSSGITHFIPSKKGTHYYLKEKMDPQQLADFFDEMLIQLPINYVSDSVDSINKNRVYTKT